MKIILILLGSIFSVQAIAIDLQLINTVGTAEKYVEPNMVIISIETYGRSDQAKTAQERQALEYKRIKNAVEKFKIKKEDFITEGLSLNPEYKYDEKSQSNKTIGFKVSHQSKIVLRMKSDIGIFLDNLSSSAKIENSGLIISSISWDIDNRKNIQDNLISLAVADARKKADLLAVAAGVKIKSVHSINYSESNSSDPGPRNFEMKSFAARNDTTELGSGTVKIKTEVSLQYLID